MKKTIILTSIAAIIALSSCKQQQKEEGINEEKFEQNMEQIQTDIKQLADNIENRAYEEKGEFQAEMENFVESTRTEVNSWGENANEEQKEAIKKIDAELKKLEKNIDEMEASSEDEWDQLKADIKDASDNVEMAIKDFFTDDEKEDTY